MSILDYISIGIGMFTVGSVAGWLFCIQRMVKPTTEEIERLESAFRFARDEYNQLAKKYRVAYQYVQHHADKGELDAQATLNVIKDAD